MDFVIAVIDIIIIINLLVIWNLPFYMVFPLQLEWMLL